MKMKTIATLGLAALLAVTGCSSKLKEPKLEDFKDGTVYVEIPELSSKPTGLVDLDGDRQVDILKSTEIGLIPYIASGYEAKAKEYGYVNSDTRKMSEQLRKDASQILQGIQNLRFDVAKDKYESQK